MIPGVSLVLNSEAKASRVSNFLLKKHGNPSHLSTCLSVCLSIYLSIYLSTSTQKNWNFQLE